MVKTKKFPVLSKRIIDELLKARALENLESLKEIEKFLKNRRGYVFKMPKRGSAVIMPFSGGLDSTVIAAMLMQEYGLEIYPMFTKRGQTYQRPEIKTANFFYNYFKKRYPGQFHRIKFVSSYFPPLEIRKSYDKVENKIIKVFDKKNRLLWGDYFYTALLCVTAVQYAYSIQIEKEEEIRTIFAGFMRSDGEGKQDHTLTAIRSIMSHVCAMTNDYRWQISPFPLEKEIGFFYDKEFFIQWAVDNDIPLEKTRSSCQSRSIYHCGECMICNTRKRAFKRAGIKDPTVYIKEPLHYRMLGNLIKISRSLRYK